MSLKMRKAIVKMSPEMTKATNQQVNGENHELCLAVLCEEEGEQVSEGDERKAVEEEYEHQLKVSKTAFRLSVDRNAWQSKALSMRSSQQAGTRYLA